MNSDDPEFINCVMEAMENGASAQDIREECPCRNGLPRAASGDDTRNPQPKE